MASPINTSNEPTPEFDARCLAILKQWQRAELPADEAVSLLMRLSQQAAANTEFANEGRAHHLLGYVHHYLGNLTTSISHYEKARRLFSKIDNEQRIATMDLNQGENYRLKGEFSRARNLYRSAYEMAHALGNIRIQTMALNNEGLVLISMGQFADARTALEESFRLSSQWSLSPDVQQTIMRLHCEIHQGLATIELHEEQFQAAWEQALAALSTARQADHVMTIGFAHRILGDVLTHFIPTQEADISKDADEHYRAALKAFQSVAAEAEIGRTMYAQGQSMAQRGRRLAAAQLFREAMVVFTRLGMRHDAALAAEAQLRVV